MFSSSDDNKQTQQNLMWLLECLTQRNQEYLRQRPNTPSLYKSGVKYEAPKQFDGECEEYRVLKQALGSAANKREVRKVLDLVQEVFGGERFCDIGRILERGGIDCDGLASWRVAELRQGGIAARPYMTSRKRLGGGTTFHALVLWPPHGSVDYVTSEDPSLLLGMGGAERAADRAEEVRKNQERCEILRKHGVPAARGAVPGLDLDALLSEVVGEDAVGHKGGGGGHHHHGGWHGPWPHGNIYYLPWWPQEYSGPDLDELEADFDERALGRAGAFRSVRVA